MIEKHGNGEAAGCDTEERERGVGDGVNVTMMFATLQVVGITEAVRTVIRL